MRKTEKGKESKEAIKRRKGGRKEASKQEGRERRREGDSQCYTEKARVPLQASH